ncbi:thioredoxin family protein [Bacillus aquiflavi]|uniref:Thioredoxin family protein n=1 Tax=Bacillus aquiflavi TaxID=2672567 RepID=A0A6B3W122_9BACI|nr:thioredoxin family protein [Bacillus aquiflavi]MBA4536929.1 thioredoxin family protein [Bacillus aquiflavi]NEY82315.1 thioredoxin family protein [Bacillus aquiflavi]UAC47746.1 thioredoxin family protein [Bacillus aquiflavi]
MEQWSKEEFSTRLAQGEKGILYLFTPLCGTCQVASKMLNVVNELIPNLPLGKADLNFLPDIAENNHIESVPCLLMFENNQIVNKLYAFHSVPYLHNLLKTFMASE